ncbi:MAG: hypothetical protein AAF901_11275 [Bacteroidota bacterium]
MARFLRPLPLFSCQKEEAVLENTPNQDIESRNLYPINDRVSIEDGRFVFPNPTVFDEFVNSLLDVNIDSLLATIPPSIYQSFYNRTGILIDGEELDKSELEAVLNQFGVVEIDGLLYRLNYATRQVYVLPLSAGTNAIQQFRAADDCITLPDLTLVTSFKTETFSVIYPNGIDGSIIFPWPDNGGGSNTGNCDDDDDQAVGCDAAKRESDDASSPQQCFVSDKCGNGRGGVIAAYKVRGIHFRLYAQFKFEVNSCFFDCFAVPHTMSVNGSWNACGPGGVGSQSGTYSENDCEQEVVYYRSIKRLKTRSLSVSATYTCGGNSYNTGTASI